MQAFIEDFRLNFIEDGRYKYILQGLGNTLIISLLAVLVGIAIGFLVAIIRSNHDKTGHMKVANALCKTLIRET